MSSMLEQAIIDADQLKETARQSAEEAIVEKYQDEIKQAVETILEQDVPSEVAEVAIDEDGDLDVAIIEDLPPAQIAETDEVVTIDLDKLEELMAEEELDPGALLNREQVAEELEAVTEDTEEVELNEEEVKSMIEEINDEEIEIDEDLLHSTLAEILAEDAISDAPEEEAAEGEELADEDPGQKAYAGIGSASPKRDDDSDLDEKKKRKKSRKSYTPAGEEPYGGGGYYDYSSRKKQLQENKSLIKEQKGLNIKVKLLEEKLDKYDTVVNKLKEKLDESSLTNTKLLYQNRILNSVSLNERQKDRIVEAISNAACAEEIKIIVDTLQSAVGTVKKRKMPESLNEVVTRSSSAFISRKEEAKKVDPFSERMKTLAGLK